MTERENERKQIPNCICYLLITKGPILIGWIHGAEHSEKLKCNKIILAGNREERMKQRNGNRVGLHFSLLTLKYCSINSFYFSLPVPLALACKFHTQAGQVQQPGCSDAGSLQGLALNSTTSELLPGAFAHKHIVLFSSVLSCRVPTFVHRRELIAWSKVCLCQQSNKTHSTFPLELPTGLPGGAALPLCDPRRADVSLNIRCTVLFAHLPSLKTC